jgi:cation:H+ antiporter
MAPIVERSRDIRRDLPVALAAAGLLGLIAADGTISRLDAGLLLALFAGWSGRVVADARHDRSSPQAERLRPTLVSLTVGLVLLVAAGRLVVMGAQGLGDLLGWDEFLVGATFVAIGTSTPEFVTAVVAARRGHGDIGVGLIIGSNVFNTLFIVGVAAGLQPVEVVWSETALVLGAGLVMTLAAVPSRDGRLGRGRGVLLLVLLVVYLAVLVRGVPS